MNLRHQRTTRTKRGFCTLWWVCAAVAVSPDAAAAARLRIMPADGGVLAVGQRLDIRVEATSEGTEPPRQLAVRVNGVDVTSRSEARSPAAAPPNSANFLLRGFSSARPGMLVIEAPTGEGTKAVSRLTVEAWAGPHRARAKNIIILLGDGMGAAHRTAARLMSRGFRNGRASGRLAMDDLDVTGMVMTGSLNAVITDSSPGMAAYVTGQKSNNNQQGVFPDNTADAFDNPRIEYLGELLRRTRGDGFGVGIVTTADVTDSTPAANAVHTSDRYAGAGIAARFFDERHTNGVQVLLGGGRRHFVPKSAGGGRTDARDLLREFEVAGYAPLSTGAQVKALLSDGKPPARLLGLFHPSHLPTLVIVTSDHECGGMAVIGVGNERYAPKMIGKAVRDYAAMLRFAPEQQLDLTPNYVVDEHGYPVDPDPSRKLLLGWTAAPDHNQNWLADRRQTEAAVASGGKGAATANGARDGASDAIPGFFVAGIIENGATPCPAPDGCPADTASVPHTIAGHTATDVPLSASGPGAWQFTGVYENTDVFLKILRAASGHPSARGPR